VHHDRIENICPTFPHQKPRTWFRTGKPRLPIHSDGLGRTTSRQAFIKSSEQTNSRQAPHGKDEVGYHGVKRITELAGQLVVSDDIYIHGYMLRGRQWTILQGGSRLVFENDVSAEPVSQRIQSRC
jgi:hypothetical protein